MTDMDYQSERFGGCVVPPEVADPRPAFEGGDMEPGQRTRDRRKAYKRAFYVAVREFAALGRDPGEKGEHVNAYAHERAMERYGAKAERIAKTAEQKAEGEARRIAGDAEKLKEACWKRLKGKAATGKEAMRWAERWERLCDAWSNHATDELAALHANVEEAVLAFALAHSDDMALERRKRLASLTVSALNKMGIAITRGERWAVEKHLEKALPEEYARERDGGAMLAGAKLGFSLARLTREAAALNAATVPKVAIDVECTEPNSPEPETT